MKSIFNIALFAIYIFIVSSCYEDYISDYDYSSVYFASQKPLRTVIADREMSIEVGVAIGGKREVNMSDWAKFIIDPELIEDTGLELMPQDYYILSNSNTFTISDRNLPIADVKISFTDKFYSDPRSAECHYAIPFKVVESSLDSILAGKSHSVVAVKYISSYQGTYYVKGELVELDADGNEIERIVYSDKDLSKNMTRDISTVATNVVCRQGLANFPADNSEEKLLISVDNNELSVETFPDGIIISNGTGRLKDLDGRLCMDIEYYFEKDGKNYMATESLIRRQDPLYDLRFEEW